MACPVWRAAIPGFLLLLTMCSEGPAAYAGGGYLPSTLATTVSAAADFCNPPCFARQPETNTAPAVHEIGVPTTYSRLSRDLAVFFTEWVGVLAADQFRTGREGLI
jgi:hypothetical protein